MIGPEDLRRVRPGRLVEPRDVAVDITPQAMAAIKAASEGGIDYQHCRLLPNGNWRVMFSERVLNRLRKITRAGESVSDVLVRIMATKPKDGSRRRPVL
jgi:hypothetical protein